MAPLPLKSQNGDRNTLQSAIERSVLGGDSFEKRRIRFKDNYAYRNLHDHQEIRLVEDEIQRITIQTLNPNSRGSHPLQYTLNGFQTVSGLRKKLGRDLKSKPEQVKIQLGKLVLTDKQRFQDLVIANGGMPMLMVETRLTTGQIFVTLQRNGKRQDIWINYHDTVAHMKDMVCDACHLTHNSFSLFVRGRPLADSNRLDESNPPVTSGTVVVVQDRGLKGHDRKFDGHLKPRGKNSFKQEGDWKQLQIGDQVTYKKRHVNGVVVELDEYSNPTVRLDDGNTYKYQRSEVKKMDGSDDPI